MVESESTMKGLGRFQKSQEMVCSRFHAVAVPIAEATSARSARFALQTSAVIPPLARSPFPRSVRQQAHLFAELIRDTM